MVIHDKFIFAHLVKTGGSFFEQFCRENVEGTRRGGDGWRKHRPLSQLDTGLLTSRFKFGAVRNPFAWYVSWWYFNGVRRKPGNSFPGIATKDFKQTLDNLFNSTGTYQVGTLKKKVPMYVPFDLMGDLDIGLLTYKFIQTFCCPVYLDLEFAEPIKDHLLTDDIIRTESLRRDIEEVFHDHVSPLSPAQLLSLYQKPRSNVTVKEDYRKFYTAGLISRIAWKERYLIDLFNYDFENGDIHDH